MLRGSLTNIQKKFTVAESTYDEHPRLAKNG